MTSSLSDIAKLANVSVKTVSGALNGGDIRMAAETRERIQRIAKEVGYVPNLAARGMRQGWMPIISVIADEVITSPFATDIVRALDDAAREQGIAVFATPLSRDRKLKEVLDEAIRFRPMRIAYAAMFHKAVLLPASIARSIHVMINCYEASGAVSSLVPDEQQAAFEMTSHLLDRGRRHLAFINLPGINAGRLRLEGFIEAHLARDLAVNEDWVLPATEGRVYSDPPKSLVYQHVQRLMALPTPPDAILCGNDRVAMEVYAALARNNRRIPEDVAVGSFDNHVDIATRLDPPLTTMALPHVEMGEVAARLLLSPQPTEIQHIKVPFRFVERAST